MVKVLCVYRDTKGGLVDSVVFGSYVCSQRAVETKLSLQALRAQEAAQAEAEEREDLEIAAEAAGIRHGSLQSRLHS